jgi:SAM-dependent methyltransferase
MEAAARDRIARLAPAGDVPWSDLAPNIRLRCPRCGANLFSLGCTKCGFEMWEEDGILHALPRARAEHFAQFTQDYEHVRAAEGRGSTSNEFYIGLPFRDASRRNSSQWRIRARTYLHLLTHVLGPNIQPGGRILDLGAGNCWLSFRLALAGHQPIAVDLLTNRLDGLGAANNYRSQLHGLFPRIQAELAHLPLQEDQFDAAIFNASFHYAECDLSAMREALRCVRPGGLVVISDTPWYPSEESGKRMVAERQATFLKHYGTASSSIRSVEFLTDDRLQALEEQLGIHWTVLTPKYGVFWAMRPLLAKIRGRRVPARFRIYVARKAQA